MTKVIMGRRNPYHDSIVPNTNKNVPLSSYCFFNLIPRTACDLMKTVYPSEGLSSHMTVIADVGVKLVSHIIKKCFSYRRVKGIPLTDFISNIKFSALISHSKLICSALYQQYHTVLRSGALR